MLMQATPAGPRVAPEVPWISVRTDRRRTTVVAAKGSDDDPGLDEHLGTPRLERRGLVSPEIVIQRVTLEATETELAREHSHIAAVELLPWLKPSSAVAISTVRGEAICRACGRATRASGEPHQRHECQHSRKANGHTRPPPGHETMNRAPDGLVRNL